MRAHLQNEVLDNSSKYTYNMQDKYEFVNFLSLLL